jgi:uncharacterized membrane protein
MKTILTSIAVGSVFAALTAAQQPPQYSVTDLGPAGTPFSAASSLNNHGLVSGSATASDGTSRAVLWFKGLISDISQPGLGGPNSGGGAVNDSGQVIGQAETSSIDPNHENFCGYGTGLQCVAFLWQKGAMTQLPSLGGNNSGWGWINNRGQVAGYAENSVRDPECPAGVAVNGSGPQVLDFEAVIWGPRPGEIRELAPLPGDSVGIALGLNDVGQAVGISGRCGNTILPGFTAGPHAVMWEADGSVHDLGNLGGTVNTALLAVGNAALFINNRGQVTGTSALPGNTVNYPFLWTKEKGMQSLPLLPGDVVGAGLGMNNQGAVVGASIGSGGASSGFPSAVLWNHGADGAVIDLNSFTTNSPFLALLTAFGINDVGEIVGFGLTNTYEIHGFLATPNSGTTVRATEVTNPGVNRSIVLENIRGRIPGGFRSPRW